MASLDLILRDTRQRSLLYRHSAALALKAGGGFTSGGPQQAYAPSTGGLSGLDTTEAQHHASQLRYLRGWPFVAIRVIANRVAGQEIRVGHRPSNYRGGPSTHKSFLSTRYAPPHIKEMAEGIEVQHDHPLIEQIERPNPLCERWHLLWVTAASCQATGKAFWWMHLDGSIWPVPPSWVRADHSNGLMAHWIVQPPNSSERYRVPADEMLYFFYPDPANPLGAISPLQTQAMAVTNDEYQQRSQQASYENGPRPSVVLKAGWMMDREGRPMEKRHLLTPEQRSQLINAVKLAWSGVMRHGEPVIVDGLIEDIMPWLTTPQEMDYVNSGAITKARIMQGLGVNSISAGEIEGANKASSWVADDHLCKNVVNPLLTMMSQVMTRRLAPLHELKGQKLYVWIDECKSHDEEMELKWWALGTSKGMVTENEFREKIDLPPRKDGDLLPRERPLPVVPGQIAGGNSVPRPRQNLNGGTTNGGGTGGSNGSRRNGQSNGRAALAGN